MGNPDLTKSKKEMIISVKTYSENEKKKLKTWIKAAKTKKSDFPINFGNILDRTAEAVNMSKSTVVNVTKEFKNNGFLSKSRKKNSGKKKIVLDSFCEGVARRVILGFYANGLFPTMAIIHSKLNEDENFPKVIIRKQLMFKWVQYHGKPVPLEREDISAQRYQYLRSIRSLRAQGYKVYYQDESWVNQNQSPSRGWHIPEKEVLGMSNSRPQIDIWLHGVRHKFKDAFMGGLANRPSGAGQRVILNEIGSEDGFLRGLDGPFIGKTNSADYHDQMNSQNFEEWFSKLLAVIPEHSVIVLDRAKYHSRVTDLTKCPTISWRKPKLIEFIKRHQVEVPTSRKEFESMIVKNLLALARLHAVDKKFVVEELIEKSGKDLHLLWLPVAHCELNPIELVWAYVNFQDKGCARIGYANY